MASEIISVIVSRFQGVRRRYLWFRGEDRAQAVSAVRVMRRYGKFTSVAFYFSSQLDLIIRRVFYDEKRIFYK